MTLLFLTRVFMAAITDLISLSAQQQGRSQSPMPALHKEVQEEPPNASSTLR